MTSTIPGGDTQKALAAHSPALYTHNLHFSGYSVQFHCHSAHFSNATMRTYHFLSDNFLLFEHSPVVNNVHR